jgi:hypothetical protein
MMLFDFDVFLFFSPRALERVCNSAIHGDCRERTLNQREFPLDVIPRMVLNLSFLRD